MLFKILQGNEASLPSTLTDGYCYFLKDKHYFYVDHKDSSNKLVRSKLSAEFADKLRYVNGNTMVEINPEDLALKSELATKANKATTLSGYGITDAYTETEVDTKLAGKSDSDHNHDSAYDAAGTAKAKADAALDSAKSYTDTKTSGMATTTVIDNKISTHNTATNAHSDIRGLITDLTTRLNALANSTDEDLDQMAEIVEYIKSNKELIDSITTSKVNVSDIINNLTTNVANKPLSAAQGVAIKTLIDDLQSEFDDHGHVIDDISGLQTALDGKAASSHGEHVTYSSTAPVMDGTATVGTAATVARSDHKHPTDTTRAAKSEFDSHVGNTSNPHNVTLAQLGITASAAEINTMDGINATAAEINFVKGVTANIQTQLNSKSDSGHTHDDRYYTESEINAKIDAINYAGSSTHGGSATSAVKLDSSAGSATQPVYFEDGKPKATTYELLKTVPADAKFTDTVYDDTVIKNSIDAKYTKPTNGIPKTDLDATVQASLAKADSAVQSLDGYATESYVDTAVSDLVNSAPETLNTLDELSKALGDDPNFATTVANQIGQKADASTVTAHTNNGDIHVTAANKATWDSKAAGDHNHNDAYYTKIEIDSFEFIAINDIDTICGTTIEVASDSGVTF